MQNDGSTSPLRQFFGQKWVKVIFALDALAVVAILGAVIWNATKTAIVVLDVTPLDARVQIGHGGGYTNGQYRLHPGSYDIVISRDGLEPKTLSVELKSGFVTTVSAFLSGAAAEGSDTSSPDFSFYEQKDSYASFRKLAEIASKDNNKTTDQDPSAEEFIEHFQKAYRLFEKLPIIDNQPSACGQNCGANYIYDTVKIEDGRSDSHCEKILCLSISDNTNSKKDFAISVIKKFGFDPDDYQIVYNGVLDE